MSGGLAFASEPADPDDYPPAPRWVLVKEAAAYARVSEATIRRWIKSRRLPASRVGPRKIEVDLNEVDKLRQPIGRQEEPET